MTDLKLRNELHLLRKLSHVVGISIIAFLVDLLPQRESLFYLSISAIIIIPFDILRLKRPDLNHRIVTFFKPIIRLDEVGTLSGTSFLIIGAFIDVILFPKKVAILALFLLAFGDPASSIFGILYGKDKIWGRKSLQGTLACFLVCTAVAWLYLLSRNYMVERVVLVSVLCGIVGALSELVQIKNLDDNLTFPVLAGFGSYVLFALFGGF